VTVTEDRRGAERPTSARLEGPAEVPRERLLERVLTTPAPVVALAAPAGYGKTTLLRQWGARDPRPFAVVPVPQHGMTAAALAEHVVAAVSDAVPVPTDPVVMPGASREALWFSTVLPVLGTAVRERPAPFVLVIDDAHALGESRAVDALLETLAASLPAGSTLVVASRLAPQRALRRMRPGGQLLELDAGDLAMDDDEAEVLVENAGLSLPPETLDLLRQRTDGWPIGLYLVARSLESGATPDEVDLPSRSTGWLDDFLRDELVDELDDTSRTVLLRCSVLDVLDGDVCAAVADEPRASAVLDRLAQRNQLLVPTDAGRTSFRVHHLLAEHLRKTLREESPEEWAAAHRRAARWFAEAGDSDSAVHHAVVASDDEWLGEYVWRHVAVLMAQGQVHRIAAWLSAAGEERIASVCLLALSDATLAIQQGDTPRMRRRILTAETLCRSRQQSTGRSTARPYLELVLTIEGRGGLAGMVRHASAALEGTAPDDPTRTYMHYLRGVALVLAGRRGPGVGDLKRAMTLSTVHDQPLQRAHPAAMLLQVALAAGDLDQARALADEARAIVDGPQMVAVATNAPILTALATASLAAGDRDAARRYADRALSMTALLGDAAAWHGVGGRLSLAQVYLQLGDLEQARPLITEARRMYEPAWRSPALDQRFEQTHRLMREVSVAPASSHPLTLAELRVLHYLPSHLSYPEIADELVLSRHTVKSQAMSVFRKLGVNGRSEAVARARVLGLLPPTG
jgi:LuxR family transcriptional regulator, maltose regulon positive regulatory protein